MMLSVFEQTSKDCKQSTRHKQKHNKRNKCNTKNIHIKSSLTLVKSTDRSVLGGYISPCCRCVLHKIWHNDIIRIVFSRSPVLNVAHTRLSIAKLLTERTIPL